MENTVLYLDCDGVILDTIDTAYYLMQQVGLDINSSQVIHDYFVNVDWNILIYEAGFINRSITKIKRLESLHLFKEIVILTKTSGNEHEEKIKRILFGKLLPEIRVITVDFSDNKDEVVNPVGQILVEDSLNNAKRWSLAGGISIIFKKDNPNIDNMEISDLEDVVKVVKVKKLSIG